MWGKVKAAAKSVGGFGFGAAKGLLTAYVKDKASSLLGIGRG